MVSKPRQQNGRVLRTAASKARENRKTRGQTGPRRLRKILLSCALRLSGKAERGVLRILRRKG